MVRSVLVPHLPFLAGEDLDLLQEEYATLLERAVGLELEVATLEASLVAFEDVYLLRCGALYAECDQADAELAQFMAALQPGNEVLAARAKAAQAQAEASRAAADRSVARGAPRVFQPDEELRALYRRTAREMHP